MSNSVELNSERPLQLIRQCPAYASTPVCEISTKSGIHTFIKDETNRFNLGAFKALGGIYAVAAFLQDQWQEENQSELDPSKLFEKELQKWSKHYTFVCASAGNHGMAVAKGAQLFKAKSRVYLAETVPESFAEKLRGLNAEVVRSGATYEDSMRAAQEDCAAGNSKTLLLSDSSWPGYTEMPTLVMEGYTIIAEELRQDFLENNNWPTHVFLQAGVGGLAAAITYHIRQYWDSQPLIIVVEPEAAPCLSESNKQGKLTPVEGPVSSMGRLDCKEASMLAFDILQQHANHYVCLSDSDAEKAVTTLAEYGVATTPSGAAGFAAIQLAQQLGVALDAGSNCLAIVTEGPV